MAEPAEPVDEQGEEGGGGDVEPELTEERAGMMNRKEKRKAMKKMRRKQTRKEMALKEREEEDDPEVLMKIRMMEKDEAERSERERKMFEERERAWMEAMEIKKQKQLEEEERFKILQLQEEELAPKLEVENANDSNEADDWEYVEEGPAEIIWQGNEITVKKKRVKVPKRNTDQQSRNKDPDRPTSNPLPPQSEAFSDYKNSSLSAQQLIENVAQQVPNFGTEQDRAHCPFHLKTGACRFGNHCSRVHFYPNKSCTLLIKNMYNGPGIAWEQDDVLEQLLEFNDEEVERCFEEFYEDVHTEFLKCGEIINFKVCRNGALHLRGNVYIHFKSMDSAVLAYESLNARYFAGKQISCEFINVTKWKVALCGEYMKSRYKTCSRGTACNFIHCYRNPGGDYEWADSNRPPPRYWVEKMVALFGYSDANEKEVSEKDSGQLWNSSKMSGSESKRYRSRRSRSRERNHSSFIRLDRKYDTVRDTGRQRRTDDDERPNKPHDEDQCEEISLKDYDRRKRRKCDIESGGEFSDKDTDRHHAYTRKSSRRQYGDRKKKDYGTESDGNLSDRERNSVAQRGCTQRSSSQHQKTEFLDDHGDYENNHEIDGDWSERNNDRDAYHDTRRSSRHKRKVGYPDNHKHRKNRAHDTDEEWSDSNRKGYDAERYPTHARKRSKHLAEVSDISDDDQEKLKYWCDHQSTERKKGDPIVKSVKSDGNHDCLYQDDEKYRSRHMHHMEHISDAQMHQEDRWEPERGSDEIFYSSKRPAGSSDDHKSVEIRSNRRYEASDSEVYSKDKVSREDQPESDRATPSKQRTSRRKSADHHHKLDSKTNEGVVANQSHKRYSSSLEEATDISEDNKECGRKHKEQHAGEDPVVKNPHHKITDNKTVRLAT